MTDYEVYDKFFADEEYELENAPGYEYSYRNGWNNGLKRASILISDEIRPHGEWQYTTHHARRYRICPFCKCEKEDDRSAGWFYCWHCGADMRGKEE